MKVVIVFLAILAASYGAQFRFSSEQHKAVAPGVAKTSRDLSADLQDYLDLIDEAAVVDLLLSYLEDREFQVVIAYLFSPEFHELFHTLHAITEFQQLMYFLNSNGIDVWHYDAIIRDFLGIAPRNNHAAKSNRSGLQGFLEELIALLPTDEARALTEHKLETSPLFADFHAAIISEESANLLAALRADPNYQHVVITLNEFGVDFSMVIEYIRYIFIL